MKDEDGTMKPAQAKSPREGLTDDGVHRVRTGFALSPHPSALIPRFRAPIPRRRALIPVIAALLLSACGFHPRGAATLPFDTLYIEAPQGSLFATQLKRVIGNGSSTRITATPAEADATLQVLSEAREKEILSLSAGGRVNELQLRYRLQYQVYDRQKNLITAPGEIVLRRDYSFNDREQLSKESEEALLYRDMQNDAVHQLVRRLQAAAKPVAKPGDKG
jgi:LPS-assembly lipoprotein